MLRILFIGSLGTQSVVTLKGLLASGQNLGVIAVAGSTVGLKAATPLRQRYIPVIDEKSSDNILSVAVKEGIPVEILQPNDSGERLRPAMLDVGIVSCFPHRLQEDLLQVPRLGCYNLHPSMLPRYRGPAPLFWQFRHGESETGVTLYEMDQQIDTGDIFAQQRVPMSNGVTEAELSLQCASQGVELIQALLQQLESGMLRLTAQDERLACHHGWPGVQDFHITTGWPAKRIYNFIRGTRHWGQPYTLRIGTQQFSIGSVDGYSQYPIPEKDYSVDGNRLRFNCYDGFVRARLTVAGDPMSYHPQT
ncbi:MAG: formyltransferase family protein [Pseudomonadota bacterium]